MGLRRKRAAAFDYWLLVLHGIKFLFALALKGVPKTTQKTLRLENAGSCPVCSISLSNSCPK